MSTETLKSEQSEVQSDESKTLDANSSEVRDPEALLRRLVEVSSESKKRKMQMQTMKSELEQLRSTLASLENQKASEQGQFKELAEKNAKKAQELEKALKDEKGRFAYQVITQNIMSAAQKAGCIDTKALVNLAASEGMINDLEPDENYAVSEEQLKSLIEQSQSKWNYLFNRTTPVVKDGAIKKAQAPNGLEGLTLDQKIKKLAEMEVASRRSAN
jgi:sugar-specific transcriptional regulator TrmB